MTGSADSCLFLAYVKLDRVTAMDNLTRVVARIAPHQVEQFEANFLEQRVMTVETLQCGKFRGFVTGGDALI